MLENIMADNNIKFFAKRINIENIIPYKRAFYSSFLKKGFCIVYTCFR